MSTKKSIAVFDLDGTLTKADTFLEFIIYTHGKGALYRALLINILFVLLHKLRLYSGSRLKERIFSHFYKNKAEEEVKNWGDQFAREILPTLLFPTARQRLDWHKEQGHHIIILTASSPIWLQFWCKKEDFELIGTHFELKNGYFTGKIQGKNCKGEEKRHRLLARVDLQDYEYTYAYGNEKSDRHYIELCTYKSYKPLG